MRRLISFESLLLRVLVVSILWHTDTPLGIFLKGAAVGSPSGVIRGRVAHQIPVCCVLADKY